jgi:hypothetical protein
VPILILLYYKIESEARNLQVGVRQLKMLVAVMHCEAQGYGSEMISFGSDSGSGKPQIPIAAPDPAPAPAQDRFIRYCGGGQMSSLYVVIDKLYPNQIGKINNHFSGIYVSY